eukprot:scaffold24815_cov138-Isochrysis_galbana.AAC.2
MVQDGQNNRPLATDLAGMWRQIGARPARTSRAVLCSPVSGRPCRVAVPRIWSLCSRDAMRGGECAQRVRHECTQGLYQQVAVHHALGDRGSAPPELCRERRQVPTNSGANSCDV